MSTADLAPAGKPSDESAWRERLLASLRDCGVQRAPRYWLLRWVLTIFALIVIGIITLIGRTIMRNELHTEGDIIVGRVLAVIWVLFVTFVLFRLRNGLIKKAWQSSARSAEEELMRSGFRRPVLYLRSFQLDQRFGRLSWLDWLLGTTSATEEQEMTKVLRNVGPVIAIGRPDEKLPPLGAARFYVSHDRWQEKVADVAREAQLVVWATGTTEGLRWEISHLIESVPPEKLVLWAHPQLLRLGPAAREAEWASFRSALGNLFHQPLPEKLGEARFFYFTKDWQPRAIAPPRTIFPFSSATRSAAKALVGVKQGQIDEARVAYSGPQTNDTFGGLIGATTEPIDWLRVAAFFAALMVWHLPRMIVFPAGAIYVLVDAAIITGAAVLTFRYLREPIAALAAAGIYFLFDLLTPQVDISLVRGSVFVWVLLAGLAWTTRRISPRAFALWLGAMCGSVVNGLFSPTYQAYALTDRYFGPVLFAATLAAAAAFLPKENSTPSAAPVLPSPPAGPPG